jgi:hypothetical protein
MAKTKVALSSTISSERLMLFSDFIAISYSCAFKKDPHGE